MERDLCTLSVYFEDPFWVGLLERREGGSCCVCKLTFGGEPRDGQVYETLLSCWRELRFSPGLPMKRELGKAVNPRRARREAAKALSGPPAGTRAQEAVKLQRTQGKESRRKESREERLAEEERRFLLRQEKRKQRHRGR